MMKLIKAIQSEIMHADLKPENDELVYQATNLIAKQYDTKIKPPGPGHPSGVNMFKRDADEQRKCILESLQLV